MQITRITLFKLTVLLCVIFFSSVAIMAMKVSEVFKNKQQQKIMLQNYVIKIKLCINRLNSADYQAIPKNLCFTFLCSVINKVDNQAVKIIKDLRNKNIPVDDIKRKMFILYHQYVQLFNAIFPVLQQIILKELQVNEKYDLIQNFIKATRRSTISQELEGKEKPIEELFDIILRHYQAELLIREKFEEDSKKPLLDKIWGWFKSK